MKKILIVCTANICRSPYAAAVLGDRLSRLPGQHAVQISSAGTKAIPGAGLCQEAASFFGVQPHVADPFAHTSSLVDASAIESADLILVMELSHRSALATLSPSARRRTFTLREAERLAQHVQLARRPDSFGDDATGDVQFREFVAELNALRGNAVPGTAADEPLWKRFGARGIDPLDIPDGHNSTNRQHRAALKQVGEATENLAAGLSRLFA